MSDENTNPTTPPTPRSGEVETEVIVQPGESYEDAVARVRSEKGIIEEPYEGDADDDEDEDEEDEDDEAEDD